MSASLPASVQVSFAHAALQHLADAAAADVLHIKGAALDPRLADPGRSGTDADVLVRPRHVEALLTALESNGWAVETHFDTGSPFRHATTLLHPVWGYGDVHRLFPGITAAPDEAFDRLWRDRHECLIAGIACPVPDLAAQRLILVLNAARGGAHASADVDRAWTTASADERGGVERLVADLGAEVGFAAGTGDLERFRHTREYDLWRIASEGGSRSAEWWARIEAAPTTRERLRLALAAPRVNTDHLTARRGRPPTRGEIVLEFGRRLGHGLREIAAALGDRLRRMRR